MSQMNHPLQSGAKVVLAVFLGSLAIILLGLVVAPAMQSIGKETLIRWGWWFGSLVFSGWISFRVYQLYLFSGPEQARPQMWIPVVLFVAIAAAALSLGKFWGYI
jgi:hypothetical protein